MGIGSIRQIFKLQNGPYPKASSVADSQPPLTQVRVTYEGCDYLCLPPSENMPHLLDKRLIKIPTASNQCLLRCTVKGKDRLFYLHKTKRIVLEIHGQNHQLIEDTARTGVTENLVYYQPQPIALEQIDNIAQKIGYPQITQHARCAKNIEIELTEAQRRQVLMVMSDPKINFRNTSYPYAFQAYIAKYLHESTLEMIELQIESEPSQTIEKQTTWLRFKDFIYRTLWTSPEKKLEKIKAMQSWAKELHHLSTHFKPLDTFINNRGPEPKETLDALDKALKNYQTNLLNGIQNIIDNIPEDDPKKIQKTRILKQLKQQLQSKIGVFQAQLDSLQTNPTKEQIDRLVSIADRDLFLRSLGSFMQDQMTTILRAGIQVSYKISNQRLHDVVQVPRLVAQLSDAKHLMLIKGQSIAEGPKDVDTYSPTPEGMQEATIGPDLPTDTPSRWFSIKPYLKNWSPTSVDKILCLITGKAASANNRHNNYFYYGVVQPLKFIFSIFEIAFSIPRLAMVIVLGLIETIFSVFDQKPTSAEFKLTYQINQWIIQFYHDFSWLVAPLTYLKHSSWNTYQRQQLDAEDQHQAVLETCTDHAGFCYTLFIYFTPQLIADSISDFFHSIFQSILNIPRDINYLTSAPKQAEETFKYVQFRHQTIQQLHELLAKRWYQAKKPRLLHTHINPEEQSNDELKTCLNNHIGYIQYNNKLFYFDNVSLQEQTFTETTQPLGDKFYTLMKSLPNGTIYTPSDDELEWITVATGRKPPSSDEYPALSYCTINHIHSPLDVFYEVMVTLSNGVVNPMFRKSPGAATFFFAISLATLGTYVIPAPALVWLKTIPAWLQYPVEKISLHFTGKSTALGFQEQVVACFLEWKLGFFSTELLVELGHGHFEIFEPLFEEPEQIVLGLVALIGLGMALQYLPELPTTIQIPGLPEIPNYYFMIINIFSEEAKGCANGTLGATSIEYGFLGLKFAMLMHSMLSGSESHEALTPLQTLILACGQKSFFKQVMLAYKDTDLSNWLTDSVFLKNLNQALANTDRTVFDVSEQQPDPRVVQVINILSATVDHTLHNQSQHFEKNEINLFKTALLKQLLEVPAFLELNKANEQVKRSLSQAPARHAEPQPTHRAEPISVKEAYQRLREAIAITKDPKNPLILSSSSLSRTLEAKQCYDYLDQCFNDYNQAVKREYANTPHQQSLYINKQDYLDIFFNKYCHQPNNNFIHSLILLNYPLTVFWRGCKFLWAIARHKPCMQHQIYKSFCKDIVIIAQLFTPLARMTADFNLYITGTLRGLAFMAALPTALTLYLLYFPAAKGFNVLSKQKHAVATFGDWFETIDDWICYSIALHRTPGLYFIRQALVRASRVAGDNHDLALATEKMSRDLDKIAEITGIQTQQPYLSSSHTRMHTALPAEDIFQQPDWDGEELPALSTLKHPRTTHQATNLRPSPHNQSLSV